ncbi:hypothetical protein L9F63_018598 [Diploptera punctata]|uniref:non-specific serine/threonine protein kinase n=1 Tax=Diploptera punctata TaxID=6984 RepID=A0AAD8EFJ2_DIPPU|nr:hypothetical protein L9F63_018598 [Diploptera punctata]
MDASTEIRKLPPSVICQLGRILDVQDAWKKLMALVPKNGMKSGDYQIPKYTVEHIELIERAGRKQNRSCSEIFLDEWGTSGRKRPDVSFLIYMLGKADLFRAADFMTSLLKAPPLPRPDVGPSAPVDVSYKTLEKLVVKLPEELNGYQKKNMSRTPLETSLTHIDYAHLEYITDNFNEVLRIEGGRKLGTGGFGSIHVVIHDMHHHCRYVVVYLGIEPSGKTVAVKRLNKDAVNAEKQFRNEVESLSKFRHENLLGLLGYSCESDMYCVVYEYMSNGSLESRLACKDRQTDILQWQTRLNIVLGTAYGIQYLHTAFEKPLIHRDIKSANILLDENLVPKIGDFGLVRLGQQQGNTMTLTTTVLGTSAYMAPEAFRGDVSVKLDTFSFGVVLLEILTGLPPYNEDREGHDLVTHVDTVIEDTGDIGILLDKSAGDWGKGILQASSVADAVYAVACSCLQDSRVKRPNISTVVQRLEEILIIIT